MNKVVRHQPGGTVANRPNEGTSLDIKIDTTIGLDGKTAIFMGADLSKAPVPDRRFVTDACNATVKDYTVKIVFGQERIDGKGLRSAIVVQMSRIGGANFVRLLDSMKNPSLQEIAQAENIPTEDLLSIFEEPPQALTLMANMALTAVTGHESCIDFYEASPFAMGVAVRSRKLSLEPVVRVDLRTSLLLGLVSTLRELLADELKDIRVPEGKP
jgi:hypothetical protein